MSLPEAGPLETAARLIQEIQEAPAVPGIQALRAALREAALQAVPELPVPQAAHLGTYPLVLHVQAPEALIPMITIQLSQA